MRPVGGLLTGGHFWPPPVLAREWFDEAAFVHALASQNLQVAHKPKHPPKTVSLKDFNSQSNALVAFLKKMRAQRHIRCVPPCIGMGWPPAFGMGWPPAPAAFERLG